jgi:hypothetical protein
LLLSISVGIGESAFKKKEEPEENNDIYIIKRRTYKSFVVEKREHYY